ncbi:DUF6527 family protein [Rhizobium johnstonii]|uniref:DUF6527 family protein n=2 Tax=Rhizobium johnstonii TaxID=3019933 RepID=UPI003F9C35D7
MTKLTCIRPEFVRRIPKAMNDGILYISEEFGTAAHNCCCGCGVKIVTPLKAGKWQMRNSDGLVTIHPSIGNWSSACQSHYIIAGNQIRWARGFSEAEILFNRAHDKRVSAAAHDYREFQEQGFFGRMWYRISRWFGL